VAACEFGIKEGGHRIKGKLKNRNRARHWWWGWPAQSRIIGYQLASVNKRERVSVACRSTLKREIFDEHESRGSDYVGAPGSEVTPRRFEVDKAEVKSRLVDAAKATKKVHRSGPCMQTFSNSGR